MKKYLLSLLFLCLSMQAVAQPIWTRPYTPNRISVEMLRPTLDTPSADDLETFTGAAFVAGTFLASERVGITAEVPVARYAVDAGTVSTSESVLGNPYIGLDITADRTPVLLELGLRLPVLSDTSAAATLGTLSDADRSDAFAANLLTAQALLNYRLEFWRHYSLRLRGGPQLAVGTSDDAATDLIGRYGLQIWREGERFIWGLGATGRALVTESGSFNDRTVHHAGGTFLLNFERAQPGLFVQVPLNSDVSDQVNWVMGVTLSVSLW
jgi:hypothetical protein